MFSFMRIYLFTYIVAYFILYVYTYLWYIHIKGGAIMSKIKFTTTIDENLLEQIKILAIKEKCSVASILEKLISDYLKSNSEGK